MLSASRWLNMLIKNDTEINRYHFLFYDYIRDFADVHAVHSA